MRTVTSGNRKLSDISVLRLNPLQIPTSRFNENV